MVQVCQILETVTRVAPVSSPSLIQVGLSAPLALAPGASVTPTIAANRPVEVTTGQFTEDYEIVGYDSVLGVALQVVDSSGFTVGTFYATAAGGALGGVSASAPTGAGKETTLTLSLGATAPAPVTVYVTSVYANVQAVIRLRREECVEQPGPIGPPVPLPPRQRIEAAQPGFRLTWPRQQRAADVAYYQLGVSAQLTWPRLGMSARRMLLAGIHRTWVVSDDPPAVAQTDEYTFVRAPGTRTDGGELFFRIGTGRIGGPEVIA